MYIHVCDICRKNEVDVKIKYKAERFWDMWYGCGWKKIELCEKCLNKIIRAKSKEEESEGK